MEFRPSTRITLLFRLERGPIRDEEAHYPITSSYRSCRIHVFGWLALLCDWRSQKEKETMKLDDLQKAQELSLARCVNNEQN